MQISTRYLQFGKTAGIGKKSSFSVIEDTKGEGYRAAGESSDWQGERGWQNEHEDVRDPVSSSPFGGKNGLTWVDPSFKVEVSNSEEIEGSHFGFPVFRGIVT